MVKADLLQDIRNHFQRPRAELLQVASNLVSYSHAEVYPHSGPSLIPAKVTTHFLILWLLHDLSREHGLLVYGEVNPHSGLIYYRTTAPESAEEFERILEGRLG